MIKQKSYDLKFHGWSVDFDPLDTTMPYSTHAHWYAEGWKDTDPLSTEHRHGRFTTLTEARKWCKEQEKL